MAIKEGVALRTGQDAPRRLLVQEPGEYLKEAGISVATDEELTPPRSGPANAIYIRDLRYRMHRADRNGLGGFVLQ
jgi:hypothetical protein